MPLFCGAGIVSDRIQPAFLSKSKFFVRHEFRLAEQPDSRRAYAVFCATVEDIHLVRFACFSVSGRLGCRWVELIILLAKCE